MQGREYLDSMFPIYPSRSALNKKQLPVVRACASAFLCLVKHCLLKKGQCPHYLGCSSQQDGNISSYLM